MWPYRKKSIGVRSGDVEGQAIGPHPSNPAIVVTGGEKILKRISFPLSLRQQQQQPSGSNLAILRAIVRLHCVVFG